MQSLADPWPWLPSRRCPPALTRGRREQQYLRRPSNLEYWLGDLPASTGLLIPARQLAVEVPLYSPPPDQKELLPLPRSGLQGMFATRSRPPAGRCPVLSNAASGQSLR